MFSPELLAQLSSDEELGAGNFVFKTAALAPDPDRRFISFDVPVDLPSRGVTTGLSLRELVELVDGLAGHYRASGIGVKEPVGVWFEDTFDYYLTYLALTRIGAIPVHVNGALDIAITVDFIAHTKAKMVLSRGPRAERLKQAIAAAGVTLAVVDLDETKWNLEPVARPYRHTKNDPVLIGHSSGTTGRPKAVQFNHEGFSFGVKKELAKQVGERVVTALPHSHASAISIFMTATLRGADVRIQSGKDPESLLEAIEAFKPDLICAFPRVFVDLCRMDFSEWDLSSVGYWLSTGDANHEPHVRKLMSVGRHCRDGEWRAGSLFIDNLGSSEFGFAAFRNVHRPDRKMNSFQRRIGRPFDWVEAQVLDDDGNCLPANVVGKLGVKSKTVTAGYWNDSLLTERNRLGGYWLTGDLVYKDEAGVFFHVDRIGDGIVTRTGTLYSCQAEELILQNLPEVFDCSIVGVVASDGYQEPVLTIELHPGRSSEGLLDRVNALLTTRGFPQIARMLLEEAKVDTGVTGKKLKRIMRTRLAVDANGASHV